MNTGSGISGGLVAVASGATVVTNSFWDEDVTGQANSSGGGTLKNSADMKAFSTFDNAGWDIELASDKAGAFWQILPGYSYPRFQVEGDLKGIAGTVADSGAQSIRAVVDGVLLNRAIHSIDDGRYSFAMSGRERAIADANEGVLLFVEGGSYKSNVVIEAGDIAENAGRIGLDFVDDTVVMDGTTVDNIAMMESALGSYTNEYVFFTATTIGTDTLATTSNINILSRNGLSMSDATSLNAGAGKVNLNAGATGAYDLTLAGSHYSILGDLGATSARLSSLTLNGDGTLTLGAAIYLGNSEISLPSTVVLTSDSRLDNTSTSNIVIGGTVTGAKALTLDADIGKVDINANLGASGSPLTSVAFASNSLDLGGDIFVNNSDVTFTPAVTLTNTVEVNTAGGDIIFTNGVTGAQSLTLNASAGDIYLDGNVGTTSTRLTELVFSAGNSGAIKSGASSNVTVDIYADRFELAGGTWQQINASLPVLVATDFRLTLGGGEFRRFLGGDGDKNSVDGAYQITDYYGLQGVGSAKALLTKDYVLANDLISDATHDTANWNNGAGFVPIGTYINVSTTDLWFTGSLDGRGKLINGFTIAIPGDDDFIGLIGHGGAGINVSDLRITNLSITGMGSNNNVGGIVGRVDANGARGSISNVSVAGAISLSAGVNSGLIAGELRYVDVINASSSGSVTGVTTSFSGGLVGNLNSISTITDSFSIATVTGNRVVGGLVGWFYNGSSANSVYAAGDVTAYMDQIGGLAGGGSGDPVLGNAYATGDVLGERNVGGLLGEVHGMEVENTYSTGKVTLEGGSAYPESIGGLIGRVGTSFASGKEINNSFFDNTVNSTLSLVGDDDSTGGTINNSPVNGKSTIDMKKQVTFTSLWDFDPVGVDGDKADWSIIENVTYPLLGFQEVQGITGRLLDAVGDPISAGNIRLVINGGLHANIEGVGDEVGDQFTFFFTDGTLQANQNILLYVDGATDANTVFNYIGAPMSGIDLKVGEVRVGQVGGDAHTLAMLSSAAGSLSNANILYDATVATLDLTIDATTAANDSVDVYFNSPLALTDHSTIDTDSGDITFADDITGRFNLTLNAASAGVRFLDNASAALGNFIVTGGSYAQEAASLVDASGAVDISVDDNIIVGHLESGGDMNLISNDGYIREVADSTVVRINNADDTLTLVADNGIGQTGTGDLNMNAAKVDLTNGAAGGNIVVKQVGGYASNDVRFVAVTQNARGGGISLTNSVANADLILTDVTYNGTLGSTVAFSSERDLLFTGGTIESTGGHMYFDTAGDSGVNSKVTGTLIVKNALGLTVDGNKPATGNDALFFTHIGSSLTLATTTNGVVRVQDGFAESNNTSAAITLGASGGDDSIEVFSDLGKNSRLTSIAFQGEAVDLGGDVFTDNADIVFAANQAVTLYKSTVNLDTNAGIGNVTFNYFLESKDGFNHNLNIAAGTGDVLFSHVGLFVPLGDIVVNPANTVTFNGFTNTAGEINIVHSGALGINNAVNAGKSFSQSEHDDSNVDTNAVVELDADIQVADGTINLESDVVLTADATLSATDSDEMIDSIVLQSDVYSEAGEANALTLDAGDDNIEVQAALGVDTDDVTTVDEALGGFDVTSAGMTEVSHEIVTDNGDITLSSAVELQNNDITFASNGGDVEVMGSLNGSEGSAFDFTIDAGETGDVTLASIGDENPLDSVTIAEADVVNMNGDVSLGSASNTENGVALTANANTLNLDAEVETDNAGMEFNTAVNVAGVSTLSTGTGEGDIVFNDAIDGASSLSADAGAGKIEVNVEVGSERPLAKLALESTDAIELGGDVHVGGLGDFIGPVVLTKDVNINASKIRFKDIVRSDQLRSLRLDANTITFDGQVGSKQIPLGLLVQRANFVTLGAPLYTPATTHNVRTVRLRNGGRAIDAFALMSIAHSFKNTYQQSQAEIESIANEVANNNAGEALQTIFETDEPTLDGLGLEIDVGVVTLENLFQYYYDSLNDLDGDDLTLNDK